MSIQERWDRLLLEAWSSDVRLVDLVILFGRKEKPELKSVSDIFDWFNELDIKRKPLKFDNTDKPVRSFIGERSIKLSAILIDKKHTLDQIHAAIHLFRWGKPAQRFTAEDKRSGVKPRTRFVKARAGDKRRDWNTVK